MKNVFGAGIFVKTISPAPHFHHNFPSPYSLIFNSAANPDAYLNDFAGDRAA